MTEIVILQLRIVAFVKVDKKVTRTWNAFIDNQKLPWIRIIKDYDKNFNQIMHRDHENSFAKWVDLFHTIKVSDVENFALKEKTILIEHFFIFFAILVVQILQSSLCRNLQR